MPNSNNIDFDDPKEVERLRFRLLGTINATGGRLAEVARIMGVARQTVWRWVHRLDLMTDLDEVRASNAKPKRREKSFRWLARYKPDDARRILCDVLWRNDGLLDACAVEMRCSSRTIYYRVERLGLWPFVKSARNVAEQKRLLGIPKPDRAPVPRSAHIYDPV